MCILLIMATKERKKGAHAPRHTLQGFNDASIPIIDEQRKDQRNPQQDMVNGFDWAQKHDA